MWTLSSLTFCSATFSSKLSRLDDKWNMGRNVLIFLIGEKILGLLFSSSTSKNRRSKVSKKRVLVKSKPKSSAKLTECRRFTCVSMISSVLAKDSAPVHRSNEKISFSFWIALESEWATFSSKFAEKIEPVSLLLTSTANKCSACLQFDASELELDLTFELAVGLLESNLVVPLLANLCLSGFLMGCDNLRVICLMQSLWNKHIIKLKSIYLQKS